MAASPLGRVSGRRWSPAEIALITADTLTEHEIAARTGRSSRAVAAQRRRLAQKRRMRLGLYPFRRRTRETTMTPFSVLQHLPLPTGPAERPDCTPGANPLRS